MQEFGKLEEGHVGLSAVLAGNCALYSVAGILSQPRFFFYLVNMNVSGMLYLYVVDVDCNIPVL